MSAIVGAGVGGDFQPDDKVVQRIADKARTELVGIDRLHHLAGILWALHPFSPPRQAAIKRALLPLFSEEERKAAKAGLVAGFNSNV